MLPEGLKVQGIEEDLATGDGLIAVDAFHNGTQNELVTDSSYLT